MEQVIEKLSGYNITVHEYKEDDKLCGYELNTYTDAGVNMILFIDFRGTKFHPENVEDFIWLFTERVDDIDIEEELRIHFQDAQYIREVGLTKGLKDFKAWKKKLKKIFIPYKKRVEVIETVFYNLITKRYRSSDNFDVIISGDDVGVLRVREIVLDIAYHPSNENTQVPLTYAKSVDSSYEVGEECYEQIQIFP